MVRYKGMHYTNGNHSSRSHLRCWDKVKDTELRRFAPDIPIIEPDMIGYLYLNWWVEVVEGRNVKPSQLRNFQNVRAELCVWDKERLRG